MVFHLALTQTIKEQERCLTKQLESGEKEKKIVNSNLSFDTFKVSSSGKVSKLKIPKKIITISRISIINSSFSIKDTLFLLITEHEGYLLNSQFRKNEKQLITYLENIPVGPSYNKVSFKLRQTSLRPRTFERPEFSVFLGLSL